MPKNPKADTRFDNEKFPLEKTYVEHIIAPRLFPLLQQPGATSVQAVVRLWAEHYPAPHPSESTIRRWLSLLNITISRTTTFKLPPTQPARPQTPVRPTPRHPQPTPPVLTPTPPPPDIRGFGDEDGPDPVPVNYDQPSGGPATIPTHILSLLQQPDPGTVEPFPMPAQPL